MNAASRRPAPPLFVGARHAVPVLGILRAKLRPPLKGAMNAFPSRLMRPPTVSLSPLEATLTAFATAIANTGLTRIASSSDATLTKYKGGAC
jgi:hypothetical protein